MERERQGERERYRDRARESERESAKYITVRAIRMLNQLNVMRSETEKRNVSTKKSHLALAQKKTRTSGRDREMVCVCVGWGAGQWQANLHNLACTECRHAFSLHRRHKRAARLLPPLSISACPDPPLRSLVWSTSHHYLIR